MGLTTQERMTQDQQVVLLLAQQFLQTQGLRQYIDFGWSNAIDYAQARNWNIAALPWPLFREVWLADPEIRAHYEEAMEEYGLLLT